MVSSNFKMEMSLNYFKSHVASDALNEEKIT